MINPLFLLSGVGMMLAGLLPVLWWRYGKLVSWRYFFLGAGVWVIAVALKAALDLTFSPVLVNWLTGIYAGLGIAVISGAYVGLRTGLFESGFTYLAVVRDKLRRMNFEQAIAVGLAFGCVEAFVLGLLSFLNVAVILAFPQILEVVTPLQRAVILEQLTLPDIMALAPIIERIFTILVHVFCTVLVVHSVKSGRTRYFMLSFLYKALLDGALPFLTMTFDVKTVTGVYYVESFVVVLGLVSAVGLFWLRDRYAEKGVKKSGKGKLLLSVAVATALIVAAAFLLAQPNAASAMERRNVDFSSLEGKYDFIVNGSIIGRSELEYAGVVDYNGETAFVIEEVTNLSSAGYEMYIEGTLYTTVDAHPLFYNTTMHKNGDSKNILCSFSDGMVTQTVTQNNATETRQVAANPDSFLIANNMISHWVLLFRAARLEPKNTYVAHLYSPDVEMDIVRSFEVSDVQEVKIKGRNYEAYVFRENTGNLNYVTPQGELLKIENSILEIVISEGEPEEGGIFR